MPSFIIINFASGNVFSRFHVFYVDFKSQMKLNFEPTDKDSWDMAQER